MLNAKAKRDLFSKIFTEYYPMVFNAIYPKVGSTDDTEDLCQEVFIAFYNNIDDINNTRAWLYGTLRNIVFQYYRKKNPESVNIEEVFEDVTLSFVNGFRDTRIIISQTLDEVDISEEERNILELVAYQRYSYSETAELMGLTKRKVEYKYTQLAKKILSILNERGIKQIEELL
jgi:RNA polymerase sigma-70 factor (ECF subfamily)